MRAKVQPMTALRRSSGGNSSMHSCRDGGDEVVTITRRRETGTRNHEDQSWAEADRQGQLCGRARTPVHLQAPSARRSNANLSNYFVSVPLVNRGRVVWRLASKKPKLSFALTTFFLISRKQNITARRDISRVPTGGLGRPSRAEPRMLPCLLCYPCRHP